MPTKAQLQEQLKREREITKDILKTNEKLIKDLANIKHSILINKYTNQEDFKSKYQGLLEAFRILAKGEINGK